MSANCRLTPALASLVACSPHSFAPVTWSHKLPGHLSDTLLCSFSCQLWNSALLHQSDVTGAAESRTVGSLTSVLCHTKHVLWLFWRVYFLLLLQTCNAGYTAHLMLRNLQTNCRDRLLVHGARWKILKFCKSR